MPDQLNLFYSELLSYIRRDVEKRKIEEGFDPSYDKPFRTFQEDLLSALRSDAQFSEKPFLGLIDQYNFLIGSRGALHLELKLLEALPQKDFVSMGLSSYFPKMYRGIPRLYAKNNPSLSKIKESFAHLPSLKKVAVEKALYSLYESLETPKGRLTVFTWVIFDGLGDWTSSQEIVRLLKEAFPQVDIEHLALIPKKFEAYVQDKEGVVFYENEAPLSLLEKKQEKYFSRADVILQTPTFYPRTKELMEWVAQENPSVKWEHVGEYGFGESNWFHPQTGRHSMGLHFLEKGILTRKIRASGFASLKNSLLLEWLFGLQDPGPSEIEQYQKSRHFYLAYLKTVIGGKIYLHALLKSLERDDLPIDLCVPDLGWFIRLCCDAKRESLPCLASSFGVKQIEVWKEDGVYIEKIAPFGKVLRLLHTGAMHHDDFQALLTASGEFVAVRGDQSFSEVVCANKIFFYDSSPHARYFVKDLAALAESRISQHRGTLGCIRYMAQAALSQVAEEEGEWVDEVYFQRSEPFDWLETSQQIGAFLQDPDTLAGFKKFNRIISEELSCNSFLIHLIRRAFAHAADPALAHIEEKQLYLFGAQKQSFRQLMQNMQLVIKKGIE